MTTWRYHYHVADSQNAPERERRLLCKTTDDKGHQEQEENVIIPFESAQKEKSPIEEVLNVTRGQFFQAGDLLEKVNDIASDKELVAFLRKKRNAVGLTLGNISLDEAEGIMHMIDGEVQAEPQDIRFEIEKILKPYAAQKPEETVKQLEQQPEEMTKKQRKELTKKIVKESHISEFIHLEAFINAATERDALKAFRDLADPEKRLQLIQDLAEDARKLVVEKRLSPSERLRALRELQGFLRHSEDRFDPPDTQELYASLSTVSGCILITEEQIGRAETIEKKPDTEQLNYEDKADRMFTREKNLAEQRRNKGTEWYERDGREFMQNELRLADEDDPDTPNAYGLLRRGFQAGGWIKSLKLSAAEEYRCVQMTLAEVRSLYGASSTHVGSPHALLESVRHFFLRTAREGIRKSVLDDQKRKGIGEINPMKDAEELREKCEQYLRGEGDRPRRAEARELSLLVAWIRSSGMKSQIEDSELKHYEQIAYATTEELEADQKDTRTALSSIPADYAVDAGKPETLVQSALELEGEKQRATSKIIARMSDDVRQYLYDHCTYEQLSGIAEKENQRTVAQLLLLNPDLSSIKALIERHNIQPTAEDLEKQQEYKVKLDAQSNQWDDQEAYTARAEREAEYEARFFTFPKETRETDTIDINKQNAEENRIAREVDIPAWTNWQEKIFRVEEAELRLEARRLSETLDPAVRPLFEEQVKAGRQESPAVLAMVASSSATQSALEELEHAAITSVHEMQSWREQAEWLKEKVAHAKEDAVAARNAQEEADRNIETIEQTLGDNAPAATLQIYKEASESNALWSTKTQESIRQQSENPILATYMGEEIQAVDAIASSINNSGLETEYQKIAERKDDVLLDVQKACLAYRDIATGLGEDLRTAKDEEITRRLDSYEHCKKKGDNETAKHMLACAERELNKLENLTLSLNEFRSQPIIELDRDAFEKYIAQKEGGSTSNYAVFDADYNGKPCIVVNTDRMSSHVRESVMIEERLHGLHYFIALHIDPSLFSRGYDNVSERLSDDLDRISSQWVKESGVESTTDWERKHWVMTELLVKLEIYDQYQSGAITECHLDDDEMEFLATVQKERKNGMKLLPVRTEQIENAGSVAFLKRRVAAADSKEEHARLARKYGPWPEAQMYGEAAEKEEQERKAEEKKKKEEERKKKEAEEEEREDEEDGEETGPVDTSNQKDGFNLDSTLADDFRAIKKYITKMRIFMDTYAEAATGENKTVVDDIDREYERLLKEVENDKHADTNQKLIDEVRELEQLAKSNAGEVDKFDATQSDLRSAPRDAGILKSFWQNIEFVSVFEVIQMGKDIIEDVKRQHQRKSEGRVGKIGKGLTGWIDKRIPYIGKLSDEFHRREKKAEIDEVNQWKESLEDVDAYEMQEMLYNTANKDHLKAIFIKLSELGRIDWNDEKMWTALSRYSVFRMPARECRRNENLREEWLRKLITDIWDDKDLYRQWKTANDGNIKSKKDDFTAEVDRLSNLDGGLGGELAKQLKIYKEIRRRQERGENIPMDNSVHPHLYEKILDYSITNGKMTMEGKFFYLVQGIACGLMNADRLRVLAGEEGGLLNHFPFIDYFYQRNNSLPEIKALAKRLRETEDETKAEHYKPGLKTTLWLELEVARENSVKQRLSKGLDRKGGEIDHDDMHYFLPRLTWSEIDNLAKPQGGGRQQQTPEGWLNAYVGYNNFLKSLGLLAKMDQEDVDGAKFSSEDVTGVIQAIAAYMRMDTILTRRSKCKEERRPSLSWSKMKTTIPVVGRRVAYDDRSVIERFATAILEEYGDAIPKAQKDPEYMRKIFFSTENGGSLSEKEQGEVAKYTEHLEADLMRAVEQKGSEGLKRILIEFSDGDDKDHFRTHSAVPDFTYQELLEDWKEKVRDENKARKIQSAA